MKIIVSDFDLTFFDNNFVENIKLVNEWVNRGNKFIIATGRSLYSLSSVIDSYDINIDFYVCNDGGVIYDKNRNEIYRKDIDENTSKELFKYLVETKAFGRVLIDTGEMETEISTARCNRLLGTINLRKDAQRVLGEILNKYSNITGYLSQNFLNINDISVNKANGIKFLVDMNDWNKKDIYTIGDNVNDFEMLSQFNGFLIDTQNSDFNLRKVSSFREAIQIIYESN